MWRKRLNLGAAYRTPTTRPQLGYQTLAAFGLKSHSQGSSTIEALISRSLELVILSRICSSVQPDHRVVSPPQTRVLEFPDRSICFNPGPIVRRILLYLQYPRKFQQILARPRYRDASNCSSMKSRIQKQQIQSSGGKMLSRALSRAIFVELLRTITLRVAAI